MFLKLIDEALLKTFFLFLRFLQIADSLFIIGAVAQFASDVADANDVLSDTYVAILAIAGTAALWCMFTSLITCCGGRLFFNIDIVVDFLIGVCFIVSSILLRRDASLSSGNFGGKYLSSANTGAYFRDASLVKAVYAFSILNIFLFLLTVLESVILLDIRRRGKHHHNGEQDANSNGHHHHHHHHTHADGCSC